jgi:hypothetical protein
MSALFRRRQVLLPTAWGWLALFCLAAAAIVVLGRGLYDFLALEEPVGARVLVVEGWIGPSGLDQAVAAFRAGRYERVLTTGGPIENWPKPPQATYAELAADYLKQHGLSDVPVTAVPGPAALRERTYRTALSVREWAQRSGTVLEAIDVYSSGAHARRSRLLYRMAFGPRVRVGVRAAWHAGYDGRGWWRTAAGARDVLEQAVELAWVTLFFWPGSPPIPGEMPGEARPVAPQSR